MLTETLVRYWHFLSILTLVSSLAIEWATIKPTMTRAEIKRLGGIDGIYGLSSISTVAAGLTLWLWVGKPAEFYTSNWVFHTKLGLVILLGIFSIVPTVFFIKNGKGNPEEMVDIPSKIRNWVRLELLLIVFIPLLATLMARGFGY